MEYKFSCPHCDQRIATTPEYIGVQATCPTCSQPFEVPEPDPSSPTRGFEALNGKTVSSKEFADAVWELMQRSARECYTMLYAALGDTGVKLTIDEQAVLSREIIIAHHWAISKAISQDSKVLDALDQRYFLDQYNLGATEEEKVHLAKAAESEMQERYAAYYKASAADVQHEGDKGEVGVLMFTEMLQRFLPMQASAPIPMLITLVWTHMNTFVGSLLEVRQEFIITDA